MTRLPLLVLVVSLGAASHLSHADELPASLSKGNRLLIQHGLQIQGMVSTDDAFHLETYRKLNYTAINWLWKSDVSKMGNPPGEMLWARWAPATNEMPPRNGEEKYAKNLIAMSLGDEPELSNPAVRDTYVKWFNDAAKSHPDQILYINNYGGQVPDATLGDFIQHAKPDMISFDVYPYRFAGANDPKRVQPTGGSPINWYSDLRRYREHARAAGIPLAIYRQTYHSESEGVRDPSEAELRLLTFVALTFNAKYITDFTYNTGATSLFDKKLGGDNHPTPMYAKLAAINAEARNLGKALVRLKPVDDAPGPNHTTGIMIIRGKHRTPAGAIEHNDMPGYSGFQIDPASPDYTDWEFGRNDPYLSGPFNETGTKNLGTHNGGLPGDVFVSWFTPLDESFDGDKFKGEVYFVVTNGLADMDGDAAQTSQQIKLNFGGSARRCPFDHLQKLDRATGKVVDLPLKRITPDVWQLDVTIPGGTCELFKFPTGAPFVGVEPPLRQ